MKIINNKNISHLTRNQLSELIKYPVWKQIGRLLLLISLYMLLAIIGYTLNNAFWLIIWCFQGILLACTLVVVHDCSHGTFLPNKSACRVMGVIIGSILWINFSLYRYLHLEHHRCTNVEGDTQRVRTHKNFFYYFLSIFHFKFLYRFVELSIKSFFNDFIDCARNEKIKVQIKQDAIIFIGLLCLELLILLYYPLLFLKYYCIPMLFYLAMTFFLTTAEHSGCDFTNDKTLNVRSVKSNFIFRFLFWNFNYHAEHHMYPAIPAPNLSKVHKLIGHNFPHTEKSYIKLHLKLFHINKTKNIEKM